MMRSALKQPAEGGPRVEGDPDNFERAVKRLCFSDTPVAGPAAMPSDEPCDAFLATDQLSRDSPGQSLLQSLAVASVAGVFETSTAPSPATPATAPSLDDLGPDLLLHVLRRAHPTAWDLCRMACVSRTWRQLCYSRVFWTKLRVSSGSIRPGVEALAARCRDVTELHIDDPRCELFILHPIVTACADSLLRVVIDCDKDATSRNEAAICSILWIISLHCKKVESVELVSTGAQGGFEYIDSKALWYLTSGFRNLRSFTCLCKNSMTKQSLYLMVIAWRELACLRVHCGQLRKEDLHCLRKCHALRVLELFGGDLGALMDRARGAGAGAQGNDQSHAPPDVIHAELEVLVLSHTATCPAHLASLLAGFPSLKRVLLNRESWARGPAEEMQRLRRQFGSLQRWLHAERGVELLMEE